MKMGRYLFRKGLGLALFTTLFALTYYSFSEAIAKNRGKHRHSRAHKTTRLPILRNLSLDTSEQNISATLENLFNYYLPARTFNGAILVAKGDSILYERYTGWANKEQDIPVNRHTAFHVASVSKTFTSGAVLRLVQEGKLQLSDRVTKYLPFFIYDDVTIQDLLTHRSGLRTYDRFMHRLPIAHKDTFLNNISILQALNEHTNQKIAQADKKFLYSNSNYAILALIIEAITGKSYKQFMEEEIFQPLQFTDTHIFSIADSAQFTPSYDANFRRYRYGFLDAVVGDKGVYTSVSDLLKWNDILNSGNFIRQSLLDSAYKPYSHEIKGSKNYGLGWRMDSVSKYNKKLIYHFGWWHGNRAVFIRDFSKNITAIVLSNKFNRSIYHVKELFTRYDIL